MASGRYLTNEASPHPQKNTPSAGAPTTIVVIDDNSYDRYGVGFNDKLVRHNFICKVYSILMCQLILTLGMMFIATYYDPFKEYIDTHMNLITIIGMVSTIGTMIPLVCCEYSRRIFPLNFILFFLFTFGVSCILALYVSRIYPVHVLYAIGLTTLICFTLTIFAFQTKIDFTVMGGVLLVAVTVLLFLLIIAFFFPGNLIRLIISAAGAIIFSIHLIYDTQRIIGGKHKYCISPNEHLLAALAIYLDVINIFIYILGLTEAFVND